MAPDTATRWLRPAGGRSRAPSGGRRPWWSQLATAVSWHRRLVAAACAAVAVTAGLQVLRPDPVARVPIVVAARQLAGGRVLVAADLAVRDVDPADSPDGAVRDPSSLTGRRLAGPVGAGEQLTGDRVLGASLLTAYATELGPTAVVTPVRVTDAGPLVLLRPGDRVDVLAVSTADASAPARARVVVADAPVLAVEPTAPTSGGGGPLDDSGGNGGGDGSGLVVLATTGASAVALAGASVGSAVSVVLHPTG